MAKKFKYKKRDGSTLRRRSQEQAGGYDSYLDKQFPEYKPKDGSNCVRILPPTWDDATHYALDVHINYGIGPDESHYLSLNKMGKCAASEDPVAVELKRAQREGEDEEYIRSLKPSRRALVWVIDRDKEEEGPKLWSMPFTLDKDIINCSIDKRSNEILAIDDPEDGYDVEFTKEGAKKRTRYTGVKIARNPSPISDDEDEQDDWLDYIAENPLPDVLNYYDVEYIASLFEGTAPSKPKRRSRGKSIDEEEETDDVPAEEEHWGGDEEEDDKPKRRSRRRATEEEEEDPKPKRRSRRSAVKEEEEEEEEEDKPARRSRRSRPAKDEEEEEEEQPKRRSRRRGKEEEEEEEEDPKPKRRSRRAVKDEEEEEEEKPKRRSRRSAAKDEEEEEDKPKRRARRKPAKDEEEEEEEEKPKRRSRRKPRKDEEDWEEDNFEDFDDDD